MKKSKKIRLVLITATLTSCNYGIQPGPAYSTDWVYAQGYPFPYLTYDCDSTILYRQTLPYYVYNNWFYAGPNQVRCQIPATLKGTVLRNSRFVMRGGFGGHGFASS
jgi:hypothetical protein